ncbi:MAG: L-serine ammonia-lyase, partial [Verrucomicrobiota bacterium]
ADEREMDANAPEDATDTLPYPFVSGVELLALANGAGLFIAELMMANETARRPAAEVEAGLDAIFEAMDACIERGVRQTGVLPGGLNVRRRARGSWK